MTIGAPRNVVHRASTIEYEPRFIDGRAGRRSTRATQRTRLRSERLQGNEHGASPFKKFTVISS